MMDFELGDDLELVVETARKLAENELTPRLRESEASRAVSDGLLGSWEEIGLADLEVPEAAGGAGLGAVARVLVNEELAAGDAGAALALDPYGPALTTLLEVAGEEAASEFVASLSKRPARALLIMGEDARVDLVSDQISIDAPWVAADSADAIVVLHGDEAILLREGCTFEHVRGAGLRAAGASRLTASSAPVVARWSNPEGAARAKSRARLYYASLLIGVMRAACDFSAAYSQERQAFGKPIGHHQALAFLIAEMRIAVDAARLLVHEAAWRIDAGLPSAVEASSAWAECIDVSRTVGPNAVQILGGHGFMADYPVEKFMREARALGLLCGGFDAAIEEAGRDLVNSTLPLSLTTHGAN